ncbi:MAG: segregation/condensation protein A [bacterium]|nr:segregation/condensation protein A [bacterium]MDT8396391.1 segregation/condensation protein A [bacterium]
MPEEKQPTNAETSPLAAYRIELESFQGPLDLLLHLIRKNELDITDIPIAQVTEQYLAYLEMMRELDLEVASEFLVMASTLVYIKSRMLLPVDEEEEEGEGEDPREELIRRLLEYQKYKKAAEEFASLPVLHHDIFVRPETTVAPASDELFTEASLFQLMDAFQRVLDDAEKRLPVELSREPFTLEEGFAFIVARLTAEPSLRFRNLFTGLDSRRKIVTVFLGVLEMIRSGRLIAVQKDYGEPISLVLNGPPETGGDDQEQS